LTPAERPILVTGAHRSGTTWVGRVLAASTSPRLGYLWEPFNPRHRPGTFPVRFPRYFEYLCAENGADYAGPLRDALAFRYRAGAELRTLRSPKDAARMGRDWARFARDRRRCAAALVKDPIALFSSEWLATTFGMRVVVMIRHPAAFAVSIRRRDWRHRFGDFLDQPLLMRDFLAPHEPQLRAAAEGRPDILDEAILLWNVLYSAVATFQERHPDWIFVRHEDVAARPLERYRELYGRLELEWTPPVERLVRDTSSAANPGQARRADAIRRASASQVRAWTSQLTAEEAAHVRRGTDPLWRRYYDDGDW
jgi:Sulfotransferase family